MVPDIEADRFAAAHSPGAFGLDVRGPTEYVDAHLPGARLVPMGQPPGLLPERPRTERVSVICATGNRSFTAAEWSRRAGVDAVSAAGGTADWRRQGRPVVRGPHAEHPAAADRDAGV